MKLVLALVLMFVVSVASAQAVYRFEVVDTITNAEIDTIVCDAPVRFNGVYSLQTTVTVLSGTGNITTILQESNDFPNRSTLSYVATDTIPSIATGTNRQVGTLYGLTPRVIVKGAGTQSTIYRTTLVVKKE